MKLPPLVLTEHIAAELLLAGLSLGRCRVARLVKDPPPGSDTYGDGSGWTTVDGEQFEREWREKHER